MPDADAQRAVPTAALGVATAVAASLAGVLVVLVADVWALAPAPQVLVDAAVGATCPVVAHAILRSGHARARTLGLVLMVSGVASAVTALATALALALPASAALTPWLVQLQSWTWVPGFLPLLTLVPLVYPDGVPTGRAWRAVARTGVAGILLVSAGVAAFPDPFAGREPVDKPFTSEALARLLTLPGAGCLVVAGLGGLLALGLRLRRASGLGRRQVVVLVTGALVLLAVTLLQRSVPDPWNVLAQAAAVVLVPVAIGVAVTRHGLYELDTAVRRAVAALAVAVCVAASYVAAFAVLRSLLPDDRVVAGALAAGLVGVLVQPLAHRLSAGVDRLYYGDRADPYAVVSRLTSRLAEDLDPDRVPQEVCRTVVDDLRLGGARLVVEVAGERRVVASAGDPAGGPASGAVPFPLRHRNEHVGSLEVTPRAGERTVDGRDAHILEVVAAQTAPVLAAVRLSRELQRSREELVGAREDERRRLRRELHDGVGASLAGIRLQLESAQALVQDPAAVRLLEAAGAGLAGAVAEVRHVTQGLRPPGIDDLGLAQALRLAAERVGAPGLAVDTAIADLPEVGPAVEAAAYRITAEALANVVRHARASRVAVRVDVHRGMLDLEVLDDGVGLPDTLRTGVGLASMRRRAEEIGGRLDVGSGDAGGTRVRARLPLGGSS